LLFVLPAASVLIDFGYRLIFLHSNLTFVLAQFKRTPIQLKGKMNANASKRQERNLADWRASHKISSGVVLVASAKRLK
jgi:hypothetical protein